MPVTGTGQLVRRADVRSWSRGDNRTGALAGRWYQSGGNENSAKEAGLKKTDC